MHIINVLQLLFTRSYRRGCWPLWSHVLKKTGEPGENHRPWTGDHCPATSLYYNSNSGRNGDKRVFYHYAIRAPERNVKLRSRSRLLMLPYRTVTNFAGRRYKFTTLLTCNSVLMRAQVCCGLLYDGSNH